MEELIQQLRAQWKKIALIGGAIIILLLLIKLLTSYGIVYVSATGSTSSSIDVYASSRSATIKTGGLGFNLVPRDATSLIIAAGESIKTETKLSIPWYGYINKSITLENDKNATKVAYYNLNARPCATYSANYNRLLSYKCYQPTALQLYATPPDEGWGNADISDTPYPAAAKPYIGGIIGITYIPNSDTKAADITVTSESGQIIDYNAPDDTDTATLNKATVYTDTYDTTNNRFVFVDTSGNIYLGTPSGNGTVHYKKTPPPANYNPTYHQTICAITGDSVYCYRGQADTGEAPSDSQLKPTTDTITSLSFTNDLSKTINVDKQFTLGNFYVAANGQLFGRDHKQLLQFVNSNNQYSALAISQNVDGAAGGQAVYYIQNNGVYQIDSNTGDTHQVFYSKNITPTTIYPVAGKVFIIGKVKGNDQVTYAYSLGSDNDTSPGQRLIDKFPVSFTAIPDASVTDLVGDTLYAELNITYWKGAPSKDKAIDKNEVAQKKQNVINTLQSMGIGVDPNKIVFTYR